MPVLPMHLRAVNFLGRSKISGVRLLRGVRGLAVRSKHGDITVAIGITTGHHCTAAFCRRLFVFCDASFCDWRVWSFFDGSARAVTLRSIRPKVKGRWATICHEF